jgi:cytochrome c-type biogenesis protein CcmE
VPVKRSKIYRFLAPFLLLCCGITLILWGASSAVSFYQTPSQILNNNSKNIVRLGGFVKAGSITYKSTNKISFVVSDGTCNINVTYQGMIPQLFGDNQGVVLKGQLHNNVFIATQMLAKHDERYKP